MPSFGRKGGGGTKIDFHSLMKASELDAEWHRCITTLLPIPTPAPKATKTSCPSLTSVNSSNSTDSTNTSYDCSYPCTHCGMVTSGQPQHIINSCEGLQERYNWRRHNIINYIDTSLDHNKYKIFCDMPDRRTSGG